MCISGISHSATVVCTHTHVHVVRRGKTKPVTTCDCCFYSFIALYMALYSLTVSTLARMLEITDRPGPLGLATVAALLVLRLPWLIDIEIGKHVIPASADLTRALLTLPNLPSDVAPMSSRWPRHPRQLRYEYDGSHVHVHDHRRSPRAPRPRLGHPVRRMDAFGGGHGPSHSSSSDAPRAAARQSTASTNAPPYSNAPPLLLPLWALGASEPTFSSE